MVRQAEMSSSERNSSDSDIEIPDEEPIEMLAINKQRPARSKVLPARLSDSACSVHQQFNSAFEGQTSKAVFYTYIIKLYL